MRKSFLGFVLVCAVIGLLATSALCWRSGKGGGEGDFLLFVAPGTIARSAQCNWVTLHTNVGYYYGIAAAAAVEGEEIEDLYVYHDSLGNTVVKLRFADVLGCIDEDATSATITLTLDGKKASETVPVTD